MKQLHGQIFNFEWETLSNIEHLLNNINRIQLSYLIAQVS